MHLPLGRPRPQAQPIVNGATHEWHLRMALFNGWMQAGGLSPC